MSCSTCNCNPCQCSCSCDPQNEALESAFQNFTVAFIGTITKTCVNGAVVWTLPCDLDSEFVGIAKGVGEPILCYWQRAIQQALTNSGAITLPLSIANGGTGSTTAATARTALGLQIGLNVEAWHATLDTWSAITRAAGFDTFATTPSSANLGTLVTDGKTGSGALVLQTSPTINTATLVDPIVTNPDNTTQTLTDAANIAWNMDLGGVAVVTLGADRSMSAPTNLKKGTYILKVVTNNHDITWNAVFKWAASTKPIHSAGTDIYSFYSDGTNLYGAAILNVG